MSIFLRPEVKNPGRVRLSFLAWMLLVALNTLGLYEVMRLVEEQEQNRVAVVEIVCDVNNKQNDAITEILDTAKLSEQLPDLKEEIEALKPEPNCAAYAKEIVENGEEAGTPVP